MSFLFFFFPAVRDLLLPRNFFFSDQAIDLFRPWDGRGVRESGSQAGSSQPPNFCEEEEEEKEEEASSRQRSSSSSSLLHLGEIPPLCHATLPREREREGSWLLLDLYYPTNNALLISFRLSSDAEILLISEQWAYKSMRNVQNRVCNVYTFQPSFHFAYHRWWLGIL